MVEKTSWNVSSLEFILDLEYYKGSRNLFDGIYLVVKASIGVEDAGAILGVFVVAFVEDEKI
jgi:hypothetical protein